MPQTDVPGTALIKSLPSLVYVPAVSEFWCGAQCSDQIRCQKCNLRFPDEHHKFITQGSPSAPMKSQKDNVSSGGS